MFWLLSQPIAWKLVVGLVSWSRFRSLANRWRATRKYSRCSRKQQLNYLPPSSWLASKLPFAKSQRANQIWPRFNKKPAEPRNALTMIGFTSPIINCNRAAELHTVARAPTDALSLAKIIRPRKWIVRNHELRISSRWQPRKEKETISFLGNGSIITTTTQLFLYRCLNDPITSLSAWSCATGQKITHLAMQLKAWMAL